MRRSFASTHALFALGLGLGGCLKDGTPPDPGKCSLGPPGADVWTWGEIRIGTCLSGPADMQFFERDGSTYLALTNANPYLDFATGSLLVIDWASIDPATDLHLMHDVRAGAIPMDDYVGGFGILAEREQALVTGRLSETAAGRSADDRAYLVDLSRPLDPRIDPYQPRLPLRDDPFPVVVDPANDRAYVGNLTDHSVAVFDTSGDLLERIDVAPGTLITVGPLADADGSGSTATLDDVDVALAEALRDDSWTVDWVDGTARIWVPTPDPDTAEAGLQRWTDVGLGPTASALGVELAAEDFGPVVDPSFVALEAPWMYWVDGDDGVIVRATNSGYDGLGPIGDWWPDSEAAQLRPGGEGAWDAELGGPEAVVVDASLWLFYDGRAPGGSPSLGFTVGAGALEFDNAPAPFLTAADQPGYTGFEDPSVWWDPTHRAFRVWMTAIRGDGSVAIGLTESLDDGASWSPVEVVIDDPAADVGAPVVRRRHGRFELWYTSDDGASFTHRHAWSWDGRTWNDDRPLLDSPIERGPLARLPRLAVQVDDTAAWRVTGRDSGPLDTLIAAGATYVDLAHGLTLRVADGYEIDNAVVPDGRARVGLLPVSHVVIDGVPTIFATAVDEARTRIAMLQQRGGIWVSAGSDLIPAGEGGNQTGVTDPVVFASDGGFTMFYAATDGEGITRMRRATSADGFAWTPVGGPALVHDDDWDAVQQLPHAVETLADGRVRVWYAGGNGGRLRIGSAIAASADEKLRPELGEFDPWRFDPGLPGSFDDGGVRDPVVFDDDAGVTHLLYAGFDGAAWSLGHAVLDDDGTFTRRLDPVSDLSLPSMTGEPLSYSSLGVSSPVLVGRSGDQLDLLHAGLDGFTIRIGRATGTPVRQWSQVRFPTVGDQLTFTTELGRTGTSVIELAQVTRDFYSTGIGMSGMTHDPARGMLYVPSKLESYIYVVDVRDDSGGALADVNALDVEGIVAVNSLGSIGFRDVLIDEARDRLYLTARDPDGVVVIDLTLLVDDDVKAVDWYTASAVLPLQDQLDDAGETTVAAMGGAGMALTPDGRYLLVAHTRGNGVAVFDLEQGAFGAEIAWLADVGEDPHLIRIAPDGRHAVVANYVGDVLDDNSSSSTLAVIDIDPASPDFLQVVTWLANR